jgi:hypothetical protein
MVHGGVKIAKANKDMKTAEQKKEEIERRLEQTNHATALAMDDLGKTELDILCKFEKFSDTIEKIQNRPQFQEFESENVQLPSYTPEELKKTSVGAGVLLGSLGGAAAGTAGGFAAAGATTSAVMALGVASTGTPIASLSGAAATNAVLAALGGGSLAAGGGGVAMGTVVLGAVAGGAALMAGGIIFSLVGGKLKNQAEDACEQVNEAEKTANDVVDFLTNLEKVAGAYKVVLESVREKYEETFGYISYLVNREGKSDWREFTDKEKLAMQNTVLLVGILYKLCQVNLVIQGENDDELNQINQTEIVQVIQESGKVLDKVA